MSTEIEVHTPPSGWSQAVTLTAPNIGAARIREAAEVMTLCKQLADAVCNTNMMPKHLRGKPEETAAVMLYGATLDMDPMQSVRSIYEVHGQPGLYGKAMVGLVIGRGHEVWTVETADDSVTVAGRRRGSSNVEQSTWTIERATTAGYVPVIDPKTGEYRLNKWGKLDGNEKYLTDPQAMLYAKAASEVCRKVAPDVLAGVYAVEDLQSERWDERLVAHVNQSSPPRGLAAALAASEPEMDAPAEIVTPSSPGSITKAQLTKLHTMLTKVGITDRDYGLSYYEATVGRRVESSKDLSRAEASQVIDGLKQIVATDADAPAPDAEHDPTIAADWMGGQS